MCVSMPGSNNTIATVHSGNVIIPQTVDSAVGSTFSEAGFCVNGLENPEYDKRAAFSMLSEARRTKRKKNRDLGWF